MRLHGISGSLEFPCQKLIRDTGISRWLYGGYMSEISMLLQWVLLYFPCKYFHDKTRNFHAKKRNFHARTRNFHAKTRNFHARTRNFHAKTFPCKNTEFPCKNISMQEHGISMQKHFQTTSGNDIFFVPVLYIGLKTKVF